MGTRTPKKLYQGALSATVTALYTTPSNTRTQIVEIWIDNQNSSTVRKIALYAHGSAATNRLAHNILVSADSSTNISDNKIMLNSGETFGMAQDIGTDVIVTIYGIEEALA